MGRSRGRRYERKEKINMKKVIGVLIAIAVIIMFIISIKSLLKRDITKETAKYEYFAMYDNNKWGVINSIGEEVIHPSYDEMIIVPDSTKNVFICTYDVNYENGTYKTKAINEKEENLYTNYETVEPIENYDKNGNLWYETNILRVKKDDKYGLINYEGIELLPCEYDTIYAVKGVKNSLIVIKDGKQGIASNTGDLIITPECKEVKAISQNYADGYIVQNMDGQFGIIDSNKRTVLEIKYEDIAGVTGNDIYLVKESGIWKIVSKKGTDLFTFAYDEVKKMNLNNIIVKKDNKYGAIDYEGKEIIKPEYDDISYISDGNYIAKKDDKYGVINSNEETILDFEYISINYREDADFIEAEKEATETLILNKNLETKLTGIISEVNTEKGFIRLREGNEYKYYNFKFEEKQAKDVLTDNTLFLSKKDDKYGFVDKDGKVVVNYIYDDATEQNRFGYSSVKKDGNWGSINKNGEVILEPSKNLEGSFVIDFIGKWHLAEELNMNYYIK